MLVLKYLGNDSWDRPVYEDSEGKLFKDTDPRKDKGPELCTSYKNSFDGEPDMPISVLSKYKDMEIEFIPKRITW